jgi:hypothetical protein
MIQPVQPETLPQKFLADLPIGRNTMPQTKLDDFKGKISSIFSGNLDIALMKFCYVDIMSETNITSLFKTYQATYDSLKSSYPHIQFVHVTVPLSVKPHGTKQFIKTLIGRKTVDVENIHRNMFNEILKRTYRDDPIFDLAEAESTYPDGTRESFEHEGKLYYALIGDYTDDGGHLNETGRKTAAEQLIDVLATAAKRRTTR